MAEVKKYLDQTGLEQLVTQIKAGDTKSVKTSNAYADSLAKNYDAAGAATTAEENAKKYTNEVAATLEKAGEAAKVQANLEAEVTRATGKEAELQSAIDAVTSTANSNKTAIDAINNEETGILAQAKADATTKANAVQAEVDALEEYVGTIPEGATATNVVAYVQEKTSGIATSENLAELTSRVAQAETDIDNIEKDYLKAADKTELEGEISDAQAAADAAQGHSEGVATDLATETSERKAADEAQVERIAALEGTIVGLSGAMHFEGVKDDVPTDVSGYEQGDVIIVGNKEYVFNGTEFVEFGDASVNAEAITALTGRMDAVEGDMTQAKTDINAVEASVATKAEKSALDQEIADRQAGDSSLDERLTEVEAQLGIDGEGTEGSVSEKIATAKQEANDEATEAAATDATTKANQALTDAKAYADAEDAKIESRVDALEDATHTHSNKALLDTYTQTEENLADAVAKKHEHANKTELDKIADGYVAKWNAAEQNAKNYADGLNSTMTSKVDAIDARVTQNTTDIATKADSDDLEALTERVTTSEANIAANASAIAAFSPIPTSDIDALFA